MSKLFVVRGTAKFTLTRVTRKPSWALTGEIREVYGQISPTMKTFTRISATIVSSHSLAAALNCYYQTLLGRE